MWQHMRSSCVFPRLVFHFRKRVFGWYKNETERQTWRSTVRSVIECRMCTCLWTTYGSEASTHTSRSPPPSLPPFVTPSKLVLQPSSQAASPRCESEGEQPQKQHVYPLKANRNASLYYLWGSWLASWFITICVVILISKHWLCRTT